MSLGCLYRRSLAALALTAVLLRVLVPAGFMPADTGSGWHLKWCPEGLSAAVMAALFRNDTGHDHHHHHHHHGHHSAALEGERTTESVSDFAGCDLAALSVEVVDPDSLAFVAPAAQQPVLSAATVAQIDRRSRHAFEPRAPPARTPIA